MGVKSNERDPNTSARIWLILLDENVFYVNMNQGKKKVQFYSQRAM